MRVFCLKKQEKFIGLDKKQYNLEKGDLVIKDESKTVSIAGIMGGLNSCVDENTRDVFLEVAYFAPQKIAQTGRRLGIVSDARYRFERGIDPLGLEEGLEYSTELIQNICGGKFSKAVKSGKKIVGKKSIKYDLNYFRKLVGYDISQERQINILSKLKLKVEKKREKFYLC